MYTFYKGYRISTEPRGTFKYYDIFLGQKCEALGFVPNDLFPSAGYCGAQEAAKDLIDGNFETHVLGDIRKLPKY